MISGTGPKVDECTGTVLAELDVMAILFGELPCKVDKIIFTSLSNKRRLSDTFLRSLFHEFELRIEFWRL